MHNCLQIGKRFLFVALIAAPFAMDACTSTPNRVHDPYYNDSHPWTRDEDRFYRNWEQQTHRQHSDFNRRSTEEQHAYFDWRHNRSGNSG
jgi:hypothetical protein